MHLKRGILWHFSVGGRFFVAFPERQNMLGSQPGQCVREAEQPNYGF